MSDHEIAARDVFEAMNDWNGMSFVHQEAAGDMCGYIARRLNDARAQAATGARAAGGESLGAECGSCGHPLNWHMTSNNPTRRCTVGGCGCSAFTSPTSKLLPAAPSSGATDEAIERAARAALDTFHVPKHPLYGFDTTTEAYRETWRDVARAVLSAASPAPTVSDTAAVLAGLVSEMRKEQDNNWGEPVTIGLRHAIALVEAVQAATEARAAGGDPHHGYTCAENEALTDGLQGDVNTVSDVLVRRGHKVDLREHGIDHWVWEALEKAAAPPTLSAPGVAELLAEVRRRQAEGRTHFISCDEIVRLLAPGGADGGGS